MAENHVAEQIRMIYAGQFMSIVINNGSYELFINTVHHNLDKLE